MFAQNVYGCKFMSCIHKKNMNHENPPPPTPPKMSENNCNSKQDFFTGELEKL